MTAETVRRKKQLEDRLATHGIMNYHISHLGYLDFDKSKFATPYDTGCRMMIFYAIAYTVSEVDDREKIYDWLKKENLSLHISPNERAFFEGKITDEQAIIELSWQGECAYILAWTLNLINETPLPTEQVSEEQLSKFMNLVPSLGGELEHFLSKLTYRDSAEIYDENLFHELATSYFRDLLFNGQKDTSDIDRNVSFLRHQALNWVRRFMDVSEWDETDTST
jgi:hypothetical protein